MKTNLTLTFIKRAALLLLLATLNSQLSTVFAQGTAFTYQGQLQNNGSLASGTYNLTFSLYANSTGGTAAAGPVTNNGVIVSNGLFTVLIDFGTGVFTGETNWLQIGVETNGASSFTTLTPRQQLTPAPYAIYAESANAAGLSGTIPAASLSGTYGGAVNLTNAGNSLSGNGAGLTGVNAAALNGLNATNFWQTVGNSGTSPTNGNFLGTTDNQPLELHAGGLRALRLEPDPRPVPEADNLIGGFTNNLIQQPGSGGDVIAGGGYDAGVNIIHSNSAGVFIGAGSANQIGPNLNDGFIGAGYGNTIQSPESVIAGGESGTIYGNAPYSTIGGGLLNQIYGDTNDYGTSVIAGGYDGTISSNSWNSFIGGGGGNTIGTRSDHSVIVGGNGNLATGSGVFIGGGGYDGTSYEGNQALANAATIGGGLGNTIESGSPYSFIGGGYNNTASGNDATVAGGYISRASGDDATVGGGYENGASGGAATVAGGSLNVASTSFAKVGGGYNNTANGNDATVCGGYGNTASGLGSFAAGGQAQALYDGDFVWADSSGGAFTSTAVNQFAVRASGGVGINTATPGAALEVDTTNHNGNEIRFGYYTGGAGNLIAGPSYVGIATGDLTTRLAILQGNGYVGIGTTSPQAALHVRGADALQFTLQNSADNSSWYFSDDVNDNLVFQPNTGVGAYIYRVDGSYHQNSDLRLKRDITALGGVLDRVLQLRPVSYHFRSAPEGTPLTLGLIAQEVEPLFPEVVGEHGGMKSLAYSELVPVTIRAVQELNQKVEDQKGELKQKETEITELKQRLEALEKIVLNQKSN